jgi:uncharacterized membrane protein
MRPLRGIEMNERRHILLWASFGLLLALIQFDAIRAAFESLGMTPAGAGLLLVGSAAGSFVDLPVAFVRAWGPRTIIAVNVGGCVVPVAFATWVFFHSGMPASTAATAVAAVAAVSRMSSRVQPGVGVTMPAFVAPMAALVAAVVLAPGSPAPLAYVAGTFGVLLGADFGRLREALRQDAPMLSIGGAGTRDGIFMAGIVAVLLA